ncbi:DUF222 domain-containing protein [Nakamurella alba]|nr:DUF222 domain-containing protein [Nakamurella alba]
MTAASETAPAARRAEDALHALSTLDPAELSGRKVIDGIAAGYQAISYLQAVLQGWMARLAEPGVIPSAEGLLKHPVKRRTAGRDAAADENSAASENASAGEGTSAGGDASGGESTDAGQDTATGEGAFAGGDASDDENAAADGHGVPGGSTAADASTSAGGDASDDENTATGEGASTSENNVASENSAAGEDSASERIYDLRASNPDSTAEFFDLMDTLEKAKARRDMAGGELAAALVLSPKSGSIYVQRAIDLVEELPDTLALLREGVLDQTRASMIHKYACKLRDQTLLCEYERRALKVAPGRAPAKLEPLLKRIITDLEPEDAAAAEKRAFNDRRTGRYDLEGAMARFYADLTAENAQLVQQLVDQIARTMGSAGGRTLEQCRADAFAAIFEQLHAHGSIDLREILAAAAYVAAGGDMPDDDDEFEDVVDESVVDEGVADDIADETAAEDSGDVAGDAMAPGDDEEDEPGVEEADREASNVADAGDNADETASTEPDDDLSGASSVDTDLAGMDTHSVGTGATADSEAADTVENPVGANVDGDADEAGDGGPVGSGRDTNRAAEQAADFNADGDDDTADADADADADVHADADGHAVGATDSQLGGDDVEAGSEPENRSDSEHPVAQEGIGCSESEPPDTDAPGNPERGVGDCDADPTSNPQGGESIGNAEDGDPPPFDPFRFDDPDTPRPSAPKWRAPVWQDRAVNPALPWNGVITISLEALAGLADHPGDMSGFGCISPDLARQLLKAANSITLLVIDPETGAPVGVSDRVYVPPGSLRRKVMLLTQTCSWVGCNRKAERCDIDHGEPFDHDNPAAGGKTTLRNLRPLCRFHHRLKTLTAWTITEHDDRSATLVSALGRTTRRPPPAVTDPGEWEPAWQTEDLDDDPPPF